MDKKENLIGETIGSAIGGAIDSAVGGGERARGRRDDYRDRRESSSRYDSEYGQERCVGVYGIADVEDRTNLSSDEIYRLISRGRFPHPVRLTAFSAVWLEFEVEDWIDSKRTRRY